MMTTPKVQREFLEALSKSLADEGKLIEAGWMALRAVHPIDEEQTDEMRMAYMAGAQHVFASIVGVMDDDDEPTEADYRRVDLIYGELQAWTAEMKARHGRQALRGLGYGG